MKRYEKANDAIHAPEELKRRVAEGSDTKRSRAKRWAVPVLAVAAVAAILLGVVLWRGMSPKDNVVPNKPHTPDDPISPAPPDEPDTPNVPDEPDVNAVALAQYPERVQIPDGDGEWDDAYFAQYGAWEDERWMLRRNSAAHKESLRAFLEASAGEFLKDAGDENRVYSPLTVYMALSMLAEATDGESRAQILELLDVPDIEALRPLAQSIWEANYCDDGTAMSILGSSLWLSDGLPYNAETVKRLAETYYASVYQGEMGSESYNESLRKWLNRQTGDLLTEQTSEVELDPMTVMALATTVYFEGRWDGGYNASKTDRQIFHGADGDTETDFMHGGTDAYYWGEHFGAVRDEFETGGAMWLILPDEDVDAASLMSDPEVLSLVMVNKPWDWERRRSLIVHTSIPKFDASSKIDLVAGLKRLGVTDVFAQDGGDFTPVTDLAPVYVSSVTHAARVTIDESGVKAASFTLGPVAPTAPALSDDIDEMDFVLDRPFLFVLEGLDGLPLFVGVVNQVS